jgi:type I restriction enzyme, R subunit
LIEAKDNSYSVGDGMQQALDYATTLNIPFVFSSNGDGFVFHDRTGKGGATETTLGLDAFPPPAELWGRYRAWKGLTDEAEEIVLQDYFDDGSGKGPRYYQVNAVNAAIEAIAKGRNRILLVMATGTGKTYTAFQIIWRLWKAGRKKRILFLADRNVLVDQTMVNDFRPFGSAMAKLSTDAKTIEREDGEATELTTAIDRKRRIDTAYEVYLGLYQAITGPEERQKLFREFSPGFFDLIVIDECHRGSAAEDLRPRRSQPDRAPAHRAAGNPQLGADRLPALARARLLHSARQRARGHRRSRGAGLTGPGLPQRPLSRHARPHGAGRTALSELEGLVR